MNNIEIQQAGEVLLVTLNRPEKLNAFAGRMREELLDALQWAAADSNVRAVIITGAGRAFSAGGDVGFMSELQQRGDTESFRGLLLAGGAIVTTIRSMPQPVIAAVGGVAAGAGCNLALACDIRIASSAATFGETFIRIGLHPDWGGTYFLPRLSGTSRAMEMMLTGRMIPAEEALQIGLVERVVPPDRLATEAMELAVALTKHSPTAVQAIKRSLYESERATLADQLDAETTRQMEAFSSTESRSAVAAFLERRSTDSGKHD